VNGPGFDVVELVVVEPVVLADPGVVTEVGEQEAVLAGTQIETAGSKIAPKGHVWNHQEKPMFPFQISLTNEVFYLQYKREIYENQSPHFQIPSNTSERMNVMFIIWK